MKKLLAISGLILLCAGPPVQAQEVFRAGTDFSSGSAVNAYSNSGAIQYHRAMRTHGTAIHNVEQKRDPAFDAQTQSAVPIPKAYTYSESGYKRLPERWVTVYTQSVNEEGQKVRRPANLDLADLIVAEAKKHDLDPLIVEIIIKHESSFNPYAVSRTGAQGLMQLMPGTATMMGCSNSLDPAQNVAAGTAYFAQQLRRFQDLGHALAAYNAGPGAVASCGGIPPYAETQNYVAKICSEYSNRRKRA